MSSLPIRTTAKIQSLRAPELEKSQGTSGGSWPRPFPCTWRETGGSAGGAAARGRRPGKAPPKSAWPWATSNSSWANSRKPPHSYRTLVRSKPQHTVGWFNLARVPGAAGVLAGGRREVSEGVHARPRQADAHLGLGICQLRLNDAKAALASFERCLETAPDNEDARFGKAVALQMQGKADEAAGLYEDILEHNPESRGGALQPDPDRHGEGRFRDGAGVLRAPAGSAAGVHGGAGRPGHVGVCHGRPRPDREVLHAAGFGRAGPFRGLVQPGAGIPEIGALAGGRGSLHGGAASCGRNPRRPTPTWASCGRNWATVPGAREAYERAIQADAAAGAPLWNLALLLEQGGQVEEAERLYGLLLEKDQDEDEARFRAGLPAAAARGRHAARRRPSRAA